jgi:hypothetical protein
VIGRGFTVLVLVLGAVAIAAVVVANSGLSFGGDDDEPASQEATAEPEARDEPAAQDEPEASPDEEPELPDNPDEVRGTDSYALTRTPNFRAGLRVLERRRKGVQGEFESLRVAPGRIDTVIVHPDDRRTNIQVRPDMEIAFDSTHDFPTPMDFRKRGLRASMLSGVDTTALLRSIDKIRRGSAERDVDYIVLSRDIIDGRIDQSAHMRIRTPRPRAFLKEPGEKLRAID